MDLNVSHREDWVTALCLLLPTKVMLTDRFPRRAGLLYRRD